MVESVKGPMRKWPILCEWIWDDIRKDYIGKMLEP